MNKILDFLADNYVIFIVISGVLLLALIGFIVTGRKKKKGEVQTADPMAQPTTTETTAPMTGEMPTTPTEAVTPDTNMDLNVTPVEPVATPVENTPVETPAVPMEPMAPTNSDEPTLVIEDKPLEPETPVASEDASNIFATPNTETDSQPMATPESAPVESAPVETPAMPTEEPVAAPTEVTPETSNEQETTSIFENQ